MKKPSIMLQLVLIILLLIITPPIYAQDESPERHPLLELLSLVPDTTTNRSEIYYADMKVSAETAIGEPHDSVREAWESMVGYPRVWVGWIPYTLPSFNAYLFSMLQDEGQSTGIEVETIERTLSFGTPPNSGMILLGDFDNEAIITAYTAETHALQARDDVTLLCSLSGCDDGFKQHLENLNIANPFGGHLGRYEPILLGDRLIFNSPDIEIIEAMLQAMNGSMPSLADSPDYQAGIELASEYGMIRQAVFYAPQSNAFFTSNTLAELPLESEQIAELQEQVSTLPPFQLVMIAEVADINNGTQTGMMFLIYDDETDANDARQAIQTNIEDNQLVSLRTQQPYQSIMTDRGELGFDVIEHAATDRYLTVVSLQSALVKMPELDANMPEFAGLQFRLFVTMIMSADTLWLMTDSDGE